MKAPEGGALLVVSLLRNPMKISTPALALALVPSGFALLYLVPVSPAALVPVDTPIEIQAESANQVAALTSGIGRSVARASMGDVDALPEAGEMSVESSPEAALAPATGLLDLILPVEPLLKAGATDEEYEAWYRSCSTTTLVANRVRLRGLLLFGRAHAGRDLAQLNISPRARCMLTDLQAVSAEFLWLRSCLQDSTKTPFTGPLPIRTSDDLLALEREYLFHDILSLELSRHEVDHAFAQEKARLAEACFQSGFYTSRFHTNSGFG